MHSPASGVERVLLNNSGAREAGHTCSYVCVELFWFLLGAHSRADMPQCSLKMPVIPWPHSSGPTHCLLAPRADSFKRGKWIGFGIEVVEGRSNSRFICPPSVSLPKSWMFVLYSWPQVIFHPSVPFVICLITLQKRFLFWKPILDYHGFPGPFIGMTSWIILQFLGSVFLRCTLDK